MNEHMTDHPGAYKDFPELLTVHEIQKILRIGRNSAYNLVYSKSFPVIRVGAMMRIPKAPFMEWLSQAHIANF